MTIKNKRKRIYSYKYQSLIERMKAYEYEQMVLNHKVQMEMLLMNNKIKLNEYIKQTQEKI